MLTWTAFEVMFELETVVVVEFCCTAEFVVVAGSTNVFYFDS